MLRFFARRVQHRAHVVREVCRGLQQQGRLANAGLAAEQHERSRHNAATKHTVELANARRNSIGVRGLNIGVLLRSMRLLPRHRVPMRRGAAHHAFRWTLLDERTPRAAVVALALPLGRAAAALGAAVLGFCFGHSALYVLT